MFTNDDDAGAANRRGSRRKFALIGCGPIVVISILVVVLAVIADRETKPEREAEQAEERRQGFHCLSAWDGNHDGLEMLVKDNLNDPNSMETYETRITPVVTDSNGQRGHAVVMEFGARNAFGGMVRNTARGWIDHDTCAATLEWIR